MHASHTHLSTVSRRDSQFPPLEFQCYDAEIAYIVSGGALNSTHSRLGGRINYTTAHRPCMQLPTAVV